MLTEQPTPSPVCLINDRTLYEFRPTGELVLVIHVGHRFRNVYTLSVEEARDLYARLRRKGFVPW